jgi:DNA-binding LytR/AlgR family response regulator
VSDERLAETVTRLRERWSARRGAPAVATPQIEQALALLREHLPALASAAPPRLAWVRAAVGNDVRLIAVADVCYFEANDKYTSVFTADGEALIRTPLKDLVAQLDPERFWQIHRGTIVNVEHVDTTTRDFTGRVRVKLRSRPKTLAVSRAFAHRFRQM